MMRVRLWTVLAVLMVAGCSTETRTGTGALSSPPPASAVPRISATATATATPTTASDVLGAVDITCYFDADDEETNHVLIPINTTLPPNFRGQTWFVNTYDCKATRPDVPLTPVETAALKASSKAGDSIDDLYGYCATFDPDDYYAGKSYVPSEGQMEEIAGMVVLCPGHPQATAWRRALARGAAELKLETSGRTFGDGVYLVGKEIKPGTYVVTGDIENCYWERQNRNGGVISNDFVLAAKRVQVTIRPTDYAFNSDSCGQWVPAR
jgi:hypothetical protein